MFLGVGTKQKNSQKGGAIPPSKLGFLSALSEIELYMVVVG